MKQITTFLILFSFLTIISSKGQETMDTLKISDLKFKSIFGMNSNQPQNTYSLLGTGFFRTPSSDNSDSLIADWINNHPNSIVVPVSSFGPTEIKNKDSKMVYCWVIDQKDTLNNYLVKNGCFPGGTMMRPKTWDEMETWEKELFQNAGKKSEINVYVDKKAYDSFIEQIKTAELFARLNKLGIWIKGTEE